MRLQQIVGRASVSDLVRQRLEGSYFHSAQSAEKVLQREFPNHVIKREPGKLAVQVKDRSFAVAVFRELH